MSGLFNLLKISNEDILLSRNFESLPINFIERAPKLMEEYIDREEYEKCCVVRDYIEYYNKLNTNQTSYVNSKADFG